MRSDRYPIAACHRTCSTKAWCGVKICDISPILCFSDVFFNLIGFVHLQASASVFVDAQDVIKFTKTGKLAGGNFIAAESSPPTSTASTPYPSRPPSTLPSHSYTLHQVLLHASIQSC
jgi:hypothetical protein